MLVRLKRFIESAAQTTPIFGSTNRFEPWQLKYRYRVHGLDLGSEIPLFGVAPADETDLPEIALGFGPVPRSLPDPVLLGARYALSRDSLTIQLDGVARFLVAQGRRITVERLADGHDAVIAGLALMRPLGTILLQRRVLAFIASAVATVGYIAQCVATNGSYGQGDPEFYCRNQHQFITIAGFGGIQNGNFPSLDCAKKACCNN
jgi:hypothetical protein